MRSHTSAFGRLPAPIRFHGTILLALAATLVASLLAAGPAQAAPTFVKAWGKAPDLVKPRDVSVGPNGDVYVSDSGNHAIHRYSPDGSKDTKWGKQGAGDGEFQTPIGLDVTASGNLLVADSSNNRIQRFFETNNFDLAFGVFGIGDGQFWTPSDVVSGAGTYVVDSGNQRVQHFDANGAFDGKWGGPGNDDGKFISPVSAAVDSVGNVYVVDSAKHKVQKFGPGGAFIASWGGLGAADGQFTEPSGIAIDDAGRLFVADSGNNRIQEFTLAGKFVDKWGALGAGDGQFDKPRGVAVGPTGEIYVADSNNNRIQKFAVPPAAPILTGTDPASPGVSLAPKIKGATQDDLTIRIYSGGGCVGKPVAEASGAELNAGGVQVNVAPLSSTVFTATATNSFDLTSGCSAPLAYSHQPAPIAAPINLRTVPVSPNPSTTPVVKADVGPDATIVRLYTTPDCSGAPIESGKASVISGDGIPVQVAKGSSTTFRATVTGDFNQTSACSQSSVTYVQKDDVVVVDPCKVNPDGPGCKPTVDCFSFPTLPDCPLLPIPGPTVTTATFDGTNLHVRLKCPARFKPKCVSRAVPVTARGFKKVKRGNRMVRVPRGKAMGQAKKVTTRSNKWIKVSFVIQPAFRARIQAMTQVDARRLVVRQQIRSKRIRKRKNRKPTTIFHTYKVRVQG